jgi:hypothetical protein
MPEITSCPQCERKLRVPENLIGKQVKCPGCGNAFVARVLSASAPPPAAAEEGWFEDLPRAATGSRSQPRPESTVDEAAERLPEGFDAIDRGSPGAQEAEGWGKVRLGALLNLIGMPLIVAALLTGALGMGFVGATSRGFRDLDFDDARALAVLTGICTLLLLLAGRVVSLIGYGFYLAGSGQTGRVRSLATSCMGLGIATVAVPVLAFLVFLLGMGVIQASRYDASSGLPIFLFAVANLGLVVIPTLLFLLELITGAGYMRAVATRIQTKGLATNARYLSMTGGGVTLFNVALGLLLFIVTMANTGGSRYYGRDPAVELFGLAMVGCGCLDLLLSFGFMIWYIVTLFLFRNEVDSFCRRL